MALNDEYIRNMLLKSAYEQKGRGLLSKRQIDKNTGLEHRLSNRELEHHLSILCDMGLLKPKTERLPKMNYSKRSSFSPNDLAEIKYRITEKGENYVKHGFTHPFQY